MFVRETALSMVQIWIFKMLNSFLKYKKIKNPNPEGILLYQPFAFEKLYENL